MLNTTVCTSKKMDDLCDDTCRLMATWIIPHLDLNGVFYADAALVRSLVFPRRTDSVEAIDAYLLDMERVGLIVLFEEKGERWQWWPGFADNQVGLRKERERSQFPEPPLIRQDAATLTAECRQDDGNMTPECPQKLNEVKLKEVNGAAATTPQDVTISKPTLSEDSCTAMLHKCLAQAGQFPSSMMAELYEQAIENVNDPELIRLAFEDTAKNGKRMSPRYLASIIERCARDGVLPGVWLDSKKPPGARASPEKPIREQLTPEQVNALIDAEMRREYGINNAS